MKEKVEEEEKPQHPARDWNTQSLDYEACAPPLCYNRSPTVADVITTVERYSLKALSPRNYLPFEMVNCVSLKKYFPLE